MRPSLYIVRSKSGLQHFTHQEFRVWLRDLKSQYPGNYGFQKLWADFLCNQIGPKTLPEFTLSVR